MQVDGRVTSASPKKLAARSGGAHSPEGESEGIHFMDAWRIPGVSAYAFCLFFAKLIAYTFLYWLPYYINSTPIEGRMLTPKVRFTGEKTSCTTCFSWARCNTPVVAPGPCAQRMS